MQSAQTHEKTRERLWHAMSISRVFTALRVSEKGLIGKEANARLESDGPNVLPSRKRITWPEIFLRQFVGPFVYLLLIAAGISFFLNEFADAIVILGAVIIAVGFGYVQEMKAENTLGALKKIVRKRAHVLRDGIRREIDAENLVAGDIIFLGEGERISADARLLDAHDFETDEAALTGESAQVKKIVGQLEKGVQIAERINMVFMGTLAARGRAKAVVVETGAKTQVGQIAESLATIREEPTPLQKKIARLARTITIALACAIFILFAGGLARGFEIVTLFTTSVAVAVAAIPESMVVAITVILVVGMARLLTAKALVRRLIATETLGSTTVICADKTGTLTEGNMRVMHVYTEQDNAQSREFALFIGMLANEAYAEYGEGELGQPQIVGGNLTDRVLLGAGIEAGLRERQEEYERNVLDELPFESRNQFMATLFKREKEHTLFAKGSPEKILLNSSEIWEWDNETAKERVEKLYSPHTEKLREQYEDLSKKGFRILAVGYRKISEEILIDGENVPLQKIEQLGENPLDGLVFVGFLALSDPLRPYSKEMVEVAHGAGIKIAMITGDNKFTAQTIAREAGLRIDHEQILDGKDLHGMSDEELQKAVEHTAVYARILPQDKLRIVNALQARGEVTAMTGDGVNDAPALKQADIGIAMGTAQDVAKEAADIVILDNNFRSIVRAVKEGRVIIDNVRKVLLYLLSGSFTELILLSVSILLGWPLPVLAGQILWVNLVEDALPALALSYELPEEDVMRLKPEKKNAPLINKQMAWIIFCVGILSDFLLVGVFAWFFLSGYDIAYVRSIVFLGLAVNSLLMVFALKSLRRPLLQIRLFDNKYLVGSVLLGFAMLLFPLYVPFMQELLRLVPIQPIHWIIIFGLAIVQLALIEMVKWVFRLKTPLSLKAM